jgi:plasmid stabilization system protein ParE
MVVVWGNSAKAELRKAYEYIALDSPQNAKIVRDTLIDLTIELPKHPEKHPPDKFKKDNDGIWRAFEKYHYRVSYRILKDQIRIVRMRHTSKSPLDYLKTIWPKQQKMLKTSFAMKHKDTSPLRNAPRVLVQR